MPVLTDRRQVAPVPGPERFAENLDVFGFALSADELAAIDALDQEAEPRRYRARRRTSMRPSVSRSCA